MNRLLLLLALGALGAACGGSSSDETTPTDETYTSGDEFDQDERLEPQPDDPL
ncbi:MAG: hypothetical protein AAF411_08005 [Myxococcota bacterium]